MEGRFQMFHIFITMYFFDSIQSTCYIELDFLHVLCIKFYLVMIHNIFLHVQHAEKYQIFELSVDAIKYFFLNCG